MPDSPLSNRKALPAAALALHVGVAETEGLVEALLYEVDFRAVDVAEAVAVDDDFDALLLEYHVVGLHVVGVIDHVGKTRTAGLFDADAKANPMAPARKESSDTISGCGG